MRWLFAVLALAWAPMAAAQNWITVEACTVEDPALSPQLFEPLGLETALAAAIEIPNGVGKFWRIEAPNGAVSHLWGTVHSTDIRALRLPPEVMSEIEAANVVAVEIDARVKSREEWLKRVYLNDWYETGGGSNRDIQQINPTVLDWIRLRTYALGWGSNAPDLLKTAALAELMLYGPCEDFASGVYPIQDSRIQMLGEIAGAQVVGLEPSDRFFEKLRQPENRDLALAMIEVYGAHLSPDLYAERVAAGHHLYQSGEMGLWLQLDLAWVTRVLGPERGPEAFTLADAWILDERNADFVRMADPYLQDGGAFIAVGAAHIPGSQGMVALLRAEGYTVTRIVIDGEAER